MRRNRIIIDLVLKGESFQIIFFRRFSPHTSVRPYTRNDFFFFSLIVRWRWSLHFHCERSQSVVIASKKRKTTHPLSENLSLISRTYCYESRCLRQPHFRLLFIPSTLSCVLGSGPNTIHQSQHSFSPLTKQSIFSIPYYVVDKQSTVHPEATFCVGFSLNSLIFYCYTLNNADSRPRSTTMFEN